MTSASLRQDRRSKPSLPKEADPRFEQINLQQMVVAFLNRSYTKGVDRLLALNVNPSLVIEGLFQDGTNVFQFEINPVQRTGKYFRVGPSTPRADAFFAQIRADAPRRKKRSGRKSTSGVKGKRKKCVASDPCGEGCIQRGRTCHVAGGAASADEWRQISRSASNFRGNVNSNPTPTPNDAPAQQENMQGQTIRQLRERARQNDIHGYGSLPKDKLIQAIQATEADPSVQTNIRKTLERRRKEESLVAKSLPGKFGKTYRDLRRINRVVGAKKFTEAAVLSGVLLAGTSAEVFRRVKQRYRDGVQGSADEALNRASGIPTEPTSKGNVMFVVGGNAGTGSDAEEMKDLIINKQNKTKGEKWFGKANKVIAFQHNEFDFEPPEGSPKNADGSPNLAWHGEVAVKQTGQYLRNYIQHGRNEAAVDLAAQMWAQGNANPGKTINVVGHGVGGQTVREAIEILGKMKPASSEGAVSGKDMLENINVVNLGSPAFGFTDDSLWKRMRFRTITSDNDPGHVMPKQSPQWVNSVDGGTARDYLENSEVREKLREAFGFYDKSAAGRAKKKKNKKGGSSNFNTGAEVWDDLVNISDRTNGGNPEAAARASAARLMNVPNAGFAKAKRNYDSKLSDSAKTAEKQSAALKVKGFVNSNIAFAVGGNGVDSDQFTQDILNAPGLSARDRKILRQKNKFVGVKRTGQQAVLDEDEGTPDRAGAEGISYYGRTIGRMIEYGQDPDAVAMAAQLHAFGQKDFSKKGKFFKKPINIVAYGDGGQIARQSLDILNKMEGGKDIAKRVRLVTLGTPDFRLTQGQSSEVNIKGEGDMWSWLPLDVPGSTVRVNDVHGGRDTDYTASKEVMGRLKQEFDADLSGRTEDTIAGLSTQQRRKQIKQIDQLINAELEALRQTGVEPSDAQIAAIESRIFNQFNLSTGDRPSRKRKRRKKNTDSVDISSQSLAYRLAFQQTRLDRQRLKCSTGNKQCGDRCIPNTQKCRVEGPQRQAQRTAGAAAAGATAATVAIFTGLSIAGILNKNGEKTTPGAGKDGVVNKILGLEPDAVETPGGTSVSSISTEKALKRRIKRERDEAAQQARQSMQSEVNKAKQELGGLVDKQKKEIKKTQDELQQAQSDLGAAKAKLKTTEQELSKSQTERNQAREQSGSKSQELGAAKADVKKLEKDVTKLKGDLDSQRIELEAQRKREVSNVREELTNEMNSRIAKIEDNSRKEIIREVEAVNKQAAEMVQAAATFRRAPVNDKDKIARTSGAKGGAINLEESRKRGFELGSAESDLNKAEVADKLVGKAVSSVGEQHQRAIRESALKFSKHSKGLVGLDLPENASEAKAKALSEERWAAIEVALERNRQRMKMLDQKSIELQRMTEERHLRAIDTLFDEAQSKGGTFTPESLESFDAEANLIHKEMVNGFDKLLSQMDRDSGTKFPRKAIVIPETPKVPTTSKRAPKRNRFGDDLKRAIGIPPKEVD